VYIKKILTLIDFYLAKGEKKELSIKQHISLRDKSQLGTRRAIKLVTCP